MSQGHGEIVREVYGAWNRGDPGLALYAAEVAFDLSRWAPDIPEVARGHDEVRKAFGRLVGMWDEITFEPEQFIEDGDTVVVPVAVHSRGKASGVAPSATVAHVFTLRDGLVTSFTLYPDLPQALEAVGLSE
jgi:ketosteroid isomerase-like protein